MRELRHDFARWRCKDQEIAPAKMPSRIGGILYRRHIFCGHQGFYGGKVGQQFRRMTESHLALTLKSFESQGRISKVGEDLHANLLHYGMAYDQESRNGYSQHSQQQ